MKTLLKRFEDLMVAVTFAQAGEYDEVNRLLGTAETEHEEVAALNNTADALVRQGK